VVGDGWLLELGVTRKNGKTPLWGGGNQEVKRGRGYGGRDTKVRNSEGKAPRGGEEKGGGESGSKAANDYLKRLPKVKKAHRKTGVPLGAWGGGAGMEPSSSSSFVCLPDMSPGGGGGGMSGSKEKSVSEEFGGTVSEHLAGGCPKAKKRQKHTPWELCGVDPREWHVKVKDKGDGVERVYGEW